MQHTVCVEHSCATHFGLQAVLDKLCVPCCHNLPLSRNPDIGSFAQALALFVSGAHPLCRPPLDKDLIRNEATHKCQAMKSSLRFENAFQPSTPVLPFAGPTVNGISAQLEDLHSLWCQACDNPDFPCVLYCHTSELEQTTVCNAQRRDDL